MLVVQKDGNEADKTTRYLFAMPPGRVCDMKSYFFYSLYCYFFLFWFITSFEVVLSHWLIDWLKTTYLLFIAVLLYLAEFEFPEILLLLKTSWKTLRNAFLLFIWHSTFLLLLMWNSTFLLLFMWNSTFSAFVYVKFKLLEIRKEVFWDLWRQK